MIKVSVLGGAGRMGKLLCEKITSCCDLELLFAVERSHKISQLEDSIFKYTSDLDMAVELSDCIIDFTTPSLTLSAHKLCEKHGTNHIIGTTGFSGSDFSSLKESRSIVTVYSSNFSIGVNLLLNLTRKASSFLSSSKFDIEIVEVHHNKKLDSPSGTALSLGLSAASGRGVDFDRVKCLSRQGANVLRRDGDIGFSSVRGGGVIGKHEVMFIGQKETIKLSHSANSREVFCDGALLALNWTRSANAGFYDMQDIFDSSTH